MVTVLTMEQAATLREEVNCVEQEECEPVGTYR